MFLEAVGVTGWFSGGCGGPRARWLSGGLIEVEGEGAPTKKLPAAVEQWGAEISAASKKYDLWPHLVAGFMATESGGQQHAKTWCCYGLMGLLASDNPNKDTTANSLAGRHVTPSELLNDTMLNVDLGAKLISQLLDKYGDNPIKVAASYNAGSPKCGAGKCSAPNRFNLVADCDSKGVAVDYVTRIIAYSNEASGKKFVGASALSPSRAALWIVGGAVVIGAAAFAVSKGVIR